MKDGGDGGADTAAGDDDGTLNKKLFHPSDRAMNAVSPAWM